MMRFPSSVYVWGTLIACVFVLLMGWSIWAWGACVYTATSVEQYQCYARQAHLIAEQNDVPTALEYVRYVIYPRYGYAMVHMVLHEIGAHAEHTGATISDINAFLKPYSDLIADKELMGGFDGVVHGYLSMYFANAKRPLPDLMSEICGTPDAIPGITEDAYMCHHAMGHAVMHASGNQLDVALPYCHALDDHASRDGCYLGVFMENGFLYNPNYHIGYPRPDAMGTSMLERCSRLQGRAAEVCNSFVGESFMIASGDVRNAFEACDRLSTETDQDACVQRLGFITIASMSHNDEDIVRFCAMYGREHHQSMCVLAAQGGHLLELTIPESTMSERLRDAVDAFRYAALAAGTAR